MEIFEKFETENIKKNRRICGINVLTPKSWTN